MKYKRLTIRSKDGYAHYNCSKKDMKDCELYYNCGECHKSTEVLYRLAELEDKIEQGELISVKTIAKFIEMAFASEPPCYYGIDGDDCVDVIETNTKEWCETHCNTDSYTECWEQYLKAKLKELQE